MKMKKMKLVNVYGGYGENDIMGVEWFVGKSIEDGVNRVRCKIVDEESEFYGDWVKFSDDLCGVSFGDENFYLVIGDGNEWYKGIDEWGIWSESKWKKWEELCYKYCDE